MIYFLFFIQIIVKSIVYYPLNSCMNFITIIIVCVNSNIIIVKLRLQLQLLDNLLSVIIFIQSAEGLRIFDPSLGESINVSMFINSKVFEIFTKLELKFFFIGVYENDRFLEHHFS